MDGKELALAAAKILYDKKALDITVLRVGHLTVVTDYLVIASGRTVQQVKSLSDEVEDLLSAQRHNARRREGRDEGKWIVLDYGEVLVHIFHPQEREFYRLEKLWDDGDNRLPLPFAQEDKPFGEV